MCPWSYLRQFASERRGSNWFLFSSIISKFKILYWGEKNGKNCINATRKQNYEREISINYN